MMILRMILAEYLRRSQIEVKIAGFDLDGFEKAMHRELSRKLDVIAYIVSEDGEFSSDTERVEAIRACFSDDF